MDANDVNNTNLMEESDEEDGDGELLGQDRYPIEYPPVDAKILRDVSGWWYRCTLSSHSIHYSKHVEGIFDVYWYPPAVLHHCAMYGRIS